MTEFEQLADRPSVRLLSWLVGVVLTKMLSVFIKIFIWHDNRCAACFNVFFFCFCFRSGSRERVQMWYEVKDKRIPFSTSFLLIITLLMPQTLWWSYIFIKIIIIINGVRWRTGLEAESSTKYKNTIKVLKNIPMMQNEVQEVWNPSIMCQGDS